MFCLIRKTHATLFAFTLHICASLLSRCYMQIMFVVAVLHLTHVPVLLSSINEANTHTHTLFCNISYRAASSIFLSVAVKHCSINGVRLTTEGSISAVMLNRLMWSMKEWNGKASQCLPLWPAFCFVATFFLFLFFPSPSRWSLSGIRVVFIFGIWQSEQCLAARIRVQGSVLARRDQEVGRWIDVGKKTEKECQKGEKERTSMREQKRVEWERKWE